MSLIYSSVCVTAKGILSECLIILAQGDSSYLSGCSVQSEHIAERENSTQSLSLCCSLVGPHLEKHIFSSHTFHKEIGRVPGGVHH